VYLEIENKEDFRKFKDLLKRIKEEGKERKGKKYRRGEV